MSQPSNAISQKEYLKKYLAGDSKKKKKRKVAKNTNLIKRSTIIDDDIDLNSMRPLTDGEVDLYQMDEDAPQIAGIVDERPEDVKTKEYYNAKRWKVFGGDDGVNVVDSLDTKKQSNSVIGVDKVNERNSTKRQQGFRNGDDSDLSPERYIRKTRHKSNSDPSPPRIQHISIKEEKYDSDPSPPRKQHISIKEEKYDSDESLPRRNSRTKVYASDSDNSPPRLKNEKRLDINNGKREKSNNVCQRIIKHYIGHSDKSIPKNKESHSSRLDPISSAKRKGSLSPPRKSSLNNSHKSKKNSSPTYSRKNKTYSKKPTSDSDFSPTRRKKNNVSSDESSSDLSPPRKVNEVNLKKKKLYKPNDSSSSDESSRSKSKKLKKTLDGKQAGLQDAKQLKKELSDLRTKEDMVFSKMDASISGAGATAIKRDRKTGKIRDLEKEKEVQKEKDAKTKVINEKYSKWGRGLKQVEDAKERAAEAIKEMNKPLARYADDEDLDNFLKAQEREGDPMLDYIKKKQKEATSLLGEKPIYRGSFNPNRFGIRPGHRWDGVVRSNGFEKEWFTQQNARKARNEEAYKWSTSDM